LKTYPLDQGSGEPLPISSTAAACFVSRLVWLFKQGYSFSKPSTGRASLAVVQLIKTKHWYSFSSSGTAFQNQAVVQLSKTKQWHSFSKPSSGTAFKTKQWYSFQNHADLDPKGIGNTR
jgi:hypothetical protein